MLNYQRANHQQLPGDAAQVRSNKAVQRAVRQALLQKKLPLSFKAKGKGVPGCWEEQNM